LPDNTDWKQVFLIIAAGIIGASQIGKAAIAVPLLRDDLGISLFSVSYIVGAYALLGAVGGVAAGFVASYFRMSRVIIAGLALIALGNLLGAIAPNLAVLIAARVVEGIGFLAIVISGPTLLRSYSSDRHQPIIFACWSAYIPVGAALMMLLGPLVMQGDWRILWIFNGALAALHALLMIVCSATPRSKMQPGIRPDPRNILDVLRSKHLLFLATGFLLYAIQYYALATFLPVFLVGRLGVPLAEAGIVSAVALSANALGNICAGVFLRMGVPTWSLIAVVFATIGITGFGVFSESSPAALVATAAGLCLGISALLPATVIATMPRLAHSSQKLALSMGLIQQASALGQSFGPPILAFWVQRFAWSGVPYLFAIIAALGLTTALLLRGTGRALEGSR